MNKCTDIITSKATYIMLFITILITSFSLFLTFAKSYTKQMSILVITHILMKIYQNR